MGDFEAFDRESVAYFDETTRVAFSEGVVAAFLEALKCYEADAVLFICEVRPDDVIENVRFDRIDCEG